MEPGVWTDRMLTALNKRVKELNSLPNSSCSPYTQPGKRPVNPLSGELPTGEPYAGEPHVRFGGGRYREFNRSFLSLSNGLRILKSTPSYRRGLSSPPNTIFCFIHKSINNLHFFSFWPGLKRLPQSEGVNGCACAVCVAKQADRRPLTPDDKEA